MDQYWIYWSLCIDVLLLRCCSSSIQLVVPYHYWFIYTEMHASCLKLEISFNLFHSTQWSAWSEFFNSSWSSSHAHTICRLVGCSSSPSSDLEPYFKPLSSFDFVFVCFPTFDQQNPKQLVRYCQARWPVCWVYTILCPISNSPCISFLATLVFLVGSDGSI